MAEQSSNTDVAANPVDTGVSLQQSESNLEPQEYPQAEVLPGDSATTRAEKVERHGVLVANGSDSHDIHERASKRVKLENNHEQSDRQKGIAPIKKEYLVDVNAQQDDRAAQYDDDAAEASGKGPQEPVGGRGGKKTKGGQNHARSFGSSRDAIQLCKSRDKANEFAPVTCPYGDKCKHEHDIRKYLRDGKREDLQTFNGMCPIFEVRGKCNAGWRCRFASSHSKEIEHEDGRKELVQVQKDSIYDTDRETTGLDHDDAQSAGIVNVISIEAKRKLGKKQQPTPKSDEYLQWLNKLLSREDGKKQHRNGETTADGVKAAQEDNRASFVESPPLPSEKRRIYYGPETPVLAPLTTQGNLPYRRLCVELGAQVTWSEMAMGMPLLQGEKQEWALMKAHEAELAPPAYFPGNIVKDYDNTNDIRFGAQIAANKPWLAVKTTEVLTNLCPHLRAIDLNCGCPIDLVFRQGAGSALLDAPGKLEKILRGMNTVSGEVPITVKIRMGTKDKKPDADKLCQRLILGGPDAQEDGLPPSGVAAITLHGRSRQQRYTRSADWEYIASCASLVKNLKSSLAEAQDTIREPDARDLPPTSPNNSLPGLPYFCGNGDVLSHIDYNTHMEHGGVDSCMIGRGALVKPWIFEEISANQYLDKSASERLTYIEKFCRNGMEYWGSDEIGLGTTRRFLLEWLSFSCRYIPIGLLEVLPPKFGERPPAFRGRSELETLLSSGNYKDWIKISEMFLGPAHKDFHFQPKHKSNSYEIEAEG